MIKIPYDDSKNYDSQLPIIVNEIRDHIKTNDDDFLILICGDTGSGKSNLGLHALSIYQNDNPSLDTLALNTSSLAIALKKVSEKPIEQRILFYDESNVNKRSSSTKINRDLIDLYMSIRGLNIFHMWCNPYFEDCVKIKSLCNY